MLSTSDVSEEIPIRLPLSCPLFLFLSFSMFWFFTDYFLSDYDSLSTYICVTLVTVSPRGCKIFLSCSFAYLRHLSDNQFLKYDSKFLFRQWSNLTIFSFHDRGVRKMGTYCCGLLLHIIISLLCFMPLWAWVCLPVLTLQFSNFTWLLALIFIILSKRCIFTKSYSSCNDGDDMVTG